MSWKNGGRDRLEERQKKIFQVEKALNEYHEVIAIAAEKIVLLDIMLAVALVMKEYSLTIPAIGSGAGVGFVNGRNIFLVQDNLKGKGSPVDPISYSIGKTATTTIDGSVVAAPTRNVVMLTGANSGGKTTLLTTVATVHILSLLGLPVPCERAEASVMPVYLFRRRTTKRIGSLEQALRSLIPVFADRQRKLVLIDEFEALTEPGAAGRIVAAMMNHVAAGSSLVLLVTHLAAEIVPHVKLPIRVDGIEASGIDREGELVVIRQPKFNHIGSSTPQHIIAKLSRAGSAGASGGGGSVSKRTIGSKKASDRTAILYGEILESLSSQDATTPVQTPLILPWNLITYLTNRTAENTGMEWKYVLARAG